MVFWFLDENYQKHKHKDTRFLAASHDTIPPTEGKKKKKKRRDVDLTTIEPEQMDC
jgi:hypothetical protein